MMERIRNAPIRKHMTAPMGIHRGGRRDQRKEDTMQYTTCSVDQVFLDPNNFRQDWTSADARDRLERLKASIAGIGLQEPPQVYPHPDIPDTYIVHNGNRRTWCCKALAAEGIAIPGYPVGVMPVIVIDSQPDESISLAGLIANEQRADLNDMERCNAYATQLARGVPFDTPDGPIYVRLSDDEIAAVVAVADMDGVEARRHLNRRIAFRHPDIAPKTIYDVVERLAKVGVGKTTRFVLKRLGLRRLCAEAQHLVQSGHLSVEMAEALMRLDHNRQVAALRRHQQHDLSKTEFTSLCQQLLEAQMQDDQLAFDLVLATWDEELERRTQTKKRDMVTGFRRHPALQSEDFLPPRNMKNTSEALMHMLSHVKRQAKQGVISDEAVITVETILDALKRSYWTV